jgi:hypothetical protein
MIVHARSSDTGRPDGIVVVEMKPQTGFFVGTLAEFEATYVESKNGRLTGKFCL